MSEFFSRWLMLKKVQMVNNIDLLLESAKPYLQAKAKILNSLNELEKTI